MKFIQNIFCIEIEKDFKFINKYFLISKLLIVILFLYLRFVNLDYFGQAFLNFDAIHYYNIGLKGYEASFEYAFFPMFPIIIWFFNLLKIPILGTLFFNLITNYISVILIYKLLKNIYLNNDNTIRTVLLIYIFSPIGIFSTILYTESLFLFLTLSAFYFYKKKEQLILCGILLGLSVCTRNFASMLFFSIFIVLLINLTKEKDKNNKICMFINILKIYIPATLLSIAYPIYLYFKTGSWRTFIDVQFDCWHRVQSTPIEIIKKDILMIINSDGIGKIVNITNMLMFYPLIIFFIYLIIKELRKKRLLKLDLILFVIGTLICITSTMRSDDSAPASCSLYRYIYSLFPLYLLISDDIKAKYFKLYAIVSGFIICLFYFFNIFLC